MSTEFNVIALAFESIKNDDLQQLDSALRIMPLERLKDNHENLLATFLANCANYSRGEAAKMIMERWNVIYPDNEKVSMFARLFMVKTINVPTLSFLVKIHKDYTFVELIDELSEWDSSDNIITACERADQIFGQQPYTTYVMLREHAVEFDNFRVEEFMIDKIVEIAPFAKKPEYVKNYLAKYFTEFKDRLPTQLELDKLAEEKNKTDEEFILPDDDTTVDLLTEGLESLGITIDKINEAKEFLKREIESSLERKKELLIPILQNQKELNLETDRVLFLIYGPSNPLVDQDLTLDTPSAKYGGCRMFLCDLFDYSEDYDYIEDWFKGSCQQCLLRIHKRAYAVRQPRPHGGFEGCFCDWKCAREYLRYVEGQEMKPDLLSHALIDAYEKKINEVGIQDRIE